MSAIEASAKNLGITELKKAAQIITKPWRPENRESSMTMWHFVILAALALGAVKVANEYRMTHEYHRQSVELERIAYQLETISAKAWPAP